MYLYYRNSTSALEASTANCGSLLLHGPNNIATTPLRIIQILFDPTVAKLPSALHAHIVTSSAPF
jgi:hypothetical protein